MTPFVPDNRIRSWDQLTEESVMPRRDHFRPPLKTSASWEGFYGGWPMVIVQYLGKILPDQFVAEPRVHLGSQIEPDCDEYEVRVYDMERDRRLVAAVEIVSPANKDRPEHRRLFVAKCAALLQQQVSVVIVDLVTIQDFNLYGDLLEMLDHRDPALSTPPPSLYAVACRHLESHNKRLLETWYQPLELSQPLPRLPLWLTDSLAVPLDLEETYEQTCRDLRLTAVV
jgi:hypothetical protein